MNETIRKSRWGLGRKKLASIALAATLMAGGITFVAATAAQAAPPSGCTQTPGVPYKASSGKAAGSGSGSCSANASRTLNYEIHRSEGPFDPLVMLATNSGTKTSYTASGSNCDAGSGSTSHHYYGKVWFSGYTSSNSGNSSTKLNICS